MESNTRDSKTATRELVEGEFKQIYIFIRGEIFKISQFSLILMSLFFSLFLFQC